MGPRAGGIGAGVLLGLAEAEGGAEGLEVLELGEVEGRGRAQRRAGMVAAAHGSACHEA